MRKEREDIKSEDFEDNINEESSFEDGLNGQPPTEVLFEYDSGANEVGVKEEEGVHIGDKEPLSQVERPNINYQDLIVEALEGGKTLSVKEIMKFISQKHTNIGLEGVCLAFNSSTVLASQSSTQFDHQEII